MLTRVGRAVTRAPTRVPVEDASGTRQNVRVTDIPTLSPDIAALLKRDAHGLVAAVVQQHDTGDVLMVGWMDDEAVRRTLTEGRVTFWSRSRQEYWRKGDTSGHVQWVKGVRLDCDGDALLVSVDQVGAACHTGDRTCFDARVLPAAVGHPDPSTR
ncbi:phosphoribosyl-AMP cyclohydrolase [Humibacillus xanthopallidus]|uniref:Phosphoribosyl-AMP cyclohydrolase n=1 Tax=Humibacillus xanthopallidus TaxID=412689 RepID=A0A543PVM8_9MICO|nr:phosphoribosyl-AMP cyclohydrolase [Humibacillus xanthopallidus]